MNEKQVITHALMMEEVNKSITALKIIGIIVAVPMSPILFIALMEPMVLLFVALFGVFVWQVVVRMKRYHDAIKTGNFTIYQSTIVNKTSRRRKKSRSYYLVFENGYKHSVQWHEYNDTRIGETHYVIVNNITNDVFKSYNVENYIMHEELAQNFAQ